MIIMTRHLSKAFIFLFFLSSLAYSGQTMNPYAIPSHGDLCVTIREVDDSPSMDECQILEVPNDSLSCSDDICTFTPSGHGNGANCSAGNSPLGVDANGAVEDCFDVWTEAENTAAGYGVGDFLADGSVPMTGNLVLENAEFIDNVNNNKICFGATGGTYNEKWCLDFETSGAIWSSIPTSASFLIQHRIRMLDNWAFSLGSSSDVGWSFETSAGNDALKLGLATGSAAQTGYNLIMQLADIEHANRSPDADWPNGATPADPTSCVTSSDETNKLDSGCQWHDQTNYNIASGAGGIILRPASGDIKIGSNDNVDYSLIFDGASNDGILKWWEDENGFSIGPAEVGVLALNGAMLSIAKAGATYISGRDITNDIEFAFGTSSASPAQVFTGAMTDHAFALRQNNSNRLFIAAAGSNAEISIVSPADSEIYIIGDDNNNDSSADANLKFMINGLPGTGTQKAHISYSETNDDLRIGYSTSANIIINSSGNVLIGNGTTSAGVFGINEDTDDGTNNATFTVPALAADTDYTLPPDDGDAGELMRTDGAGVLTWVAPTYRSKIAFEDPVATDDFFFDELHRAVTFSSIYCKTLVGTVDLDVQIAGADLNGADITCNTTGVLDSSLGGDTSGAIGEEVKLAVTSVASTPTYLMVIVNGTYVD